ncbi:MAG: flavin reductase family protein [Thermoplasmatota archaeon]
MDEASKKKLLRMVPYGYYLLGTREAEVKDVQRDVNVILATLVMQTSFKPPMLALACRKESRTRAMIETSRVFALSMLAEGQKQMGAAFFKDVAHADGKLNGYPFELSANVGCPVFPETLGHIECRVESAVDGENDHTVYMARIVDAHASRDGAPLSQRETGWTYAG